MKNEPEGNSPYSLPEGVAVPIRIGDTPNVPLHASTYNQDGLISMHSTEFAQNQRFAKAYAKAKATGSWSGPWGQADIHWRAHLLCWAALQSQRLDGDFVECGVDKGGTAMLVMEYLSWDQRPNKTFYLYDTFSGLDTALSSKTELEQTANVYSPCYEEVRARFAHLSNAFIVQGVIPDALLVRHPEKVAYLHIDLNAAKPEVAALNFFWERLVFGAIVIFDDYGWVACRSQKESLDSFALRRNHEILTLPTGQGLLIKG